MKLIYVVILAKTHKYNWLNLISQSVYSVNIWVNKYNCGYILLRYHVCRQWCMEAMCGDAGEWRGRWVHWDSLVPEFDSSAADVPPSSTVVLVPTVDTVRTEYLVDVLVRRGNAVLLLGDRGSAKSSVVHRYLTKTNSDRHLSKTIVFSSATTATHLQVRFTGFRDDVDLRCGCCLHYADLSLIGPVSWDMLTSLSSRSPACYLRSVRRRQVNCLFHAFAAAPLETGLFLSPDSGNHCRMIDVIRFSCCR